MPSIQTLSINDSYNKYLYIIDPYKTNNATQVTAYSIPVPTNSAFSVVAEFFCSDVGFNNVADGNLRALFLRKTGNVSRTSTTSTGLVSTLLGNFAVTQPSIDLVANPSTQAIDVKLTGTTAIIDWHIELTIYRSN